MKSRSARASFRPKDFVDRFILLLFSGAGDVDGIERDNPFEGWQFQYHAIDIRVLFHGERHGTRQQRP